MPAQLIVNADDFGLTQGVNRAIAELHKAGVLTSTTLMATGAAFADAVEIARRHPTLGVGCHIVFTDGTPAADPATIPSLLGPDRKNLHPSLAQFALDALRGRIDPDDLTREAVAQIRYIQAAGLTPTHADTHKHTHIFPGILRSVLRALEQTGVPAIRNPFEPTWTHALGQGGFLRRAQLTLLRSLRPRFHAVRRALAQSTVQTTNGSIGVSATGDLTPKTLHQLLRALPSEGVYELVCHPGYNDQELGKTTTRLRQHREVERDALLTCLAERLAQPNPPQLIHYQDLAKRLVTSPNLA